MPIAKPKVPGLFKGLGVTLKTLGHTIRHGADTVQYPHEKEAPPTRAARRHRASRGQLHRVHAVRPVVSRLVHLHRGPQAARPAARAGGKPRTVSHLDRFDIDYALCMYCGICVEVCPFDALFWSPEYEYSEPRIADLLHDKDKLGEWMETVPEAPELEAGAEKKK